MKENSGVPQQIFSLDIGFALFTVTIMETTCDVEH